MSKLFEINGEKKSLNAWCKAYSISWSTVNGRINAGWDILNALTKPVDPRLSQAHDPNRKGITKTDAERMLDDSPREKIPQALAKQLINFNGKRAGDYLRRHHRAIFDAWFERTYSRT